MSQQQQQKEPSVPDVRQFEPGHVMTRQHYERLAREAAGQK